MHGHSFYKEKHINIFEKNVKQPLLDNESNHSLQTTVTVEAREAHALFLIFYPSNYYVYKVVYQLPSTYSKTVQESLHPKVHILVVNPLV